MWPNEDAFFDADAVLDQDNVLELHVVANGDTDIDLDIPPQYAIRPVAHHLAHLDLVPDERPAANFRIHGNLGRRVNTHVIRMMRASS